WDSNYHALEITGTNAVVSGVSVNGTVDVKANGVTLKNSRITTSGQSSFGVALRHSNNVTLSNDTITGMDTGTGRLMVGVKDIYGDVNGTQVLRDNIAMTSTGVQIDSGLVQDTYIHDTGLISGDHINGVKSGGGTV